MYPKKLDRRARELLDKQNVGLFFRNLADVLEYKFGERRMENVMVLQPKVLVDADSKERIYEDHYTARSFEQYQVRNWEVTTILGGAE